MKTVFWVSLFVVCYTYFGYAILLYFLVKVKALLHAPVKSNSFDLPTLTVVVAAFNEADCIQSKVENTLLLDYPRNRIAYLFVTDGSTDNTPNIVAQFPMVKLLHRPERAGKMAAIERAMGEVETDVVVFTDANTLLNKEALLLMARHYSRPEVGAVAGEKRIRVQEAADATAGEGIYWKYESLLKKWDSALYSVVGAAGELFSIRKSLYQPVEQDTILDDFMISMRIAQRGFRIVYEPGAFALESASESTGEELKRKIRIGAGGIQSTIRLWPLLLPFQHPVLTFQYISHRILRWTLCPLGLVLIFFANLYLLFSHSTSLFYVLFLMAQLFFYAAAVGGWFLAKRSIKVKALFVPYYFCLMNFAVVAGWFRYFMGKQSVLWEKAVRKQN